MMPAVRTALIAFATVLLLAGCAGLFDAARWKSLLSGTETLRMVSIAADPDVNGGFPVALDIVFVTEQRVLDTLAGLRAAEWFAGKTDFLRQHPKSLAVSSWEPVPGQRFEDIDLPAQARAAAGVLVFADYSGGRTYRMLIQGRKKALIRLRREDFDLAPE